MSEDLEKYGFDFDIIEKTFDSRLLAYEQTLEEITKPGVSMARFGDGELQAARQAVQHRFSAVLDAAPGGPPRGRRLARAECDDRLPPGLQERAVASFAIILDETIEIFRHEKVFANTAVSRPPCFGESGPRPSNCGRRCGTRGLSSSSPARDPRFDLYPEFFGNATQIDFLYSSPIDAYSEMDDLLKQIDDMPRYDKYLLSLGPTATIMANRLAASGRDALDIGHLSGSEQLCHPEGCLSRTDAPHLCAGAVEKLGTERVTLTSCAVKRPSRAPQARIGGRLRWASCHRPPQCWLSVAAVSFDRSGLFTSKATSTS